MDALVDDEETDFWTHFETAKEKIEKENFQKLIHTHTTIDSHTYDDRRAFNAAKCD